MTQPLTMGAVDQANREMPKVQREAKWRAKLLLLAGSLFFCFFLLVLGEVYCRLFLNIQLQGNSRELFADAAFGESMGNAKNIKAVSFGEDVWTDENGFRISPDSERKKNKSALLILGDSVGFGCGVEESKTFAGLLRQGLPDTTVYNSSVIGYALPDYRNVVEYFLPKHPEVKEVYLSFCVNDVSHRSASQILQFVQATDDDTIGRVKALPLIRDVHGLLRSESKLYLGLKNALTAPSLRYFRNDLELYQVDEDEFDKTMSPVLDIDRQLKEHGIPFTIVLAPCEPQLRSTNPAFEVPQKRLTAYFQKHKLRSIDPLSTFREYPGKSSDLYLSGDAMHFSEAGHRLYFQFILSDIEKTRPTSSS